MSVEDGKDRPGEVPVNDVRDVVRDDKASGPRVVIVETDETVRRELARRSRRGFLVGGAAVLGTFAGWEWLRSRPEEDGIPWPLRRSLQFDEKVARAYFSDARTVPTFQGTGAELPRTNGDVGLGEFDAASWRLRVEGLAGHTAKKGGAAFEVTLEDIKRLPRVEYTTYLKCIEGWSDMGHWAGARLLDFAAKYGPATKSGQPPDVFNRPGDLPDYVSLSTPDDEYYVGLDTASALHPQTLLAYEMGGKPLTVEHGAPLRLCIPVKYGVKNLKRVGTISFTNERPPDYWAERGYDWYAGH